MEPLRETALAMNVLEVIRPLDAPPPPAYAAAQASQIGRPRMEPATPALLKQIFALSLILPEDWANLPAARRAAAEGCVDTCALLEFLVAEGLLTRYQASRLSSGKTFGLVLGNYRVLDRLGAGAMGVVYKAEHLRMRRVVAIKVLALPRDEDCHLLARFYSEMRAVAKLRHPHIVGAIDAGETQGNADDPVLHYFVMDYVQGQDLEAHVKQFGPLPPARACQIIYQAAAALDEAHKHNLVHRDIKPSNILLTADDQAQLLDFGLAMYFRNRMTEPGTLLGTIDYMAPEQARDASSVDVRADIYSLGATFFWCLTGQTPFPAKGSMAQDLIARLTQTPPSVRSLRPDVAPELDDMVMQMMALDPEGRYATPQAVMRALLRFIRQDSLVSYSRSNPPARPAERSSTGGAASQRPWVLVVDDEEHIRLICRSFLHGDTMECDVAAGGTAALAMLAKQPYDLMLLDVNMPGMSGLELVRRVRENAPSANLKIIMFSGHMEGDDMAPLLQAGVDDFLTKPFTGVQLVARIKACLGHKQAEDRSDQLNTLLLTANAELEKNLGARDGDLVHTRNVLVLAMARIVEQRNMETGAHLIRLQQYCRCLAEEAAQLPLFAATITADFIHMLECCVPLHDIGMVTLPDHILLKPGKLTAEERVLMQQHTTVGAATLQAVTRQQGSLAAFMHMAGDIARHHHEHHDGTGYPDRLRGTDIPLGARLACIADVYDALRCRRVYRPAMSHASALQIMTVISEGHFDPALVPVLERCGPRLEALFRELGD